MSRVAPVLLFSMVLGLASVSVTTTAHAAPVRPVAHSTQLTPGGVIIVQNLTPGGIIIVQN